MSSDLNLSGLLKFTIGNRSYLQSALLYLVPFICILFLGETSILVMLIPILNFGLFTFFKIQSIVKQTDKTPNNVVNFVPIGNPHIISTRLFKITLIQLIIITVMDIESFIHPQLINNYFIVYLLILGVLQIFLLFYQFNDIALYSKIEMENNSLQKKLLSYLKMDEFKKLYHNLKLLCIVFEILWWLLIILSVFFDLLPIQLTIPGTNLAEGTPIKISLLSVIILYLMPFLEIFYLKKVYFNITNINPQEINAIMNQLPKIEQEKIMKTLQFYLNV